MLTVRIDVDYMRQSIVTAFENYQIRQIEELQGAIDKAIREFDFDKAIRDILHPEINNALKQAIHTACWDALYTEELRREVFGAVKRILERKHEAGSV